MKGSHQNEGLMTSPDQVKLNEQLGTSSVPKGMVFIAVKDKDTGMYPIPSHRNYFGPVKVSNLIVDSGCQGHLIAISSVEMLDDIFRLLSEDKFEFTICKSIGTAGTTSIIMVQPFERNDHLPIKIAVDLFSDEEVARLPRLRFAISSAQAGEIIKDEKKLNRFLLEGHKRSLHLHAQATVPQLPISLLGNAIADQVDEIRYSYVRFYVRYKALDDKFFSSLPRLASAIEVTLRPDKETRDSLDVYASEFAESAGDSEYDF
eukprot:gene8743-9634_t